MNSNKSKKLKNSNQRSSGGKQQVAMPVQKSKKQAKPKKPVRDGGLVSGKSIGNVAFYKALTDPFAPSSLGCQVPDPFPFPTETFHIHQTSVLGSSATFSSGAAMFLPNPLLSMVDLTFANSLLTTKKAVQSTPMTPISASTTIPANGIYGSTTQASLISIYSSYRVVSWGIKISNLQPELSATGRLMLAYFPTSDTTPTLGDIAVASTNAIVSGMVGVNSNSLESSVILNAPTAVELTVGDLIRGDIQLSGLYSNTNFFSFKNPQLSTSLGGAASAGDDVGFNAAGAPVSIQYKDPTRMPGGAGIVLYWEGLPAGTTNAFQVETIYHLEGTPNFATTANNALIPSTGAKPNVGPTNAVEASISAASITKNLFTYIKNGFEFLNENKATILNVASMIP